MTLQILLATLLAGSFMPQAAGQIVKEGSAGVTNPKLVQRVDPKYPPAAWNARITGDVSLVAVVGVDGKVKDVRVVASDDSKYGLAGEAVRAVKNWVFEPGKKGGVNVPVAVNLVLTFRLDQVLEAEQALWKSAVPVDAPGVVTPVLERSAEPRYTKAAMQAKIQGVVELDIVILADGTVGATRVTKSLDSEHGLDVEALAVARRWLFRPGTLNGKPVAVKATLKLEFKLH